MREMLAGVADRLSLHMPGAQGRGPFGPVDPYRLETTELGVTDDLYAPCGAIARAEALAARCAGAAHTLMLTGGSTAGGAGHAALRRGRRRGGDSAAERAPFRAAPVRGGGTGRGVWPGRRSRRRVCVTPRTRAIWRRWNAARTRGRCWWSGRITTACCTGRRARRRGARALGVPVLCDEAHGAHLNWDAEAPTAGALGADVWVQSAHKTLPALNGGAWLHAGPGVDAARLRAMLRAVQTSSPSFVTLLALDDARAWMEQNGRGGRRAAQGRGGAVSRAGGGAGLRRWAGRAGLGLRPHARGAPGPAGRVCAFGGAGRAGRGRGDERRRSGGVHPLAP